MDGDAGTNRSAGIASEGGSCVSPHTACASLCAEHRELIPRASNPCGLVVSDRERGWLVTLEEFWRLGQGLEEAAKWRRVSALKGFAR